jgi:hypothetical protein
LLMLAPEGGAFMAATCMNDHQSSQVGCCAVVYGPKTSCISKCIGFECTVLCMHAYIESRRRYIWDHMLHCFLTAAARFASTAERSSLSRSLLSGAACSVASPEVPGPCLRRLLRDFGVARRPPDPALGEMRSDPGLVQPTWPLRLELPIASISQPTGSSQRTYVMNTAQT